MIIYLLLPFSLLFLVY